MDVGMLLCYKIRVFTFWVTNLLEWENGYSEEKYMLEWYAIYIV